MMPAAAATSTAASSSTHSASSMLPTSSTAPGVPVPSDLRCRYAYKECKHERSQRKNGKLHSLCEFHRRKANSVQKLYAMKRRNNGDGAARPPRQGHAISPTRKSAASTTHNAAPAAHHHHTMSFLNHGSQYAHFRDVSPRSPTGESVVLMNPTSFDDDTYYRLVEIKRRIHDAWERRAYHQDAIYAAPFQTPVTVAHHRPHFR
ncbi:Aste57867_18349 [Aphanomyces stellatus]|uniref:Aste57867_18349 protein n=1 Tax=Aphanomyces stellatus TaxID=120398 RepID=A0A485LAQ6_9STRA|nr:hypothetical protein As57867_018287 [Aphanomyces stellatus]VFT95085.1 Aste57867_18349 [Aphanomyces stellatus]